MTRVESEAEAREIAAGRTAYLFQSKVVKAIYLFVVEVEG